MSVIHIVDDEESVRSSLAFLLQIAGFDTRVYASAASLLARADRIEDGCIVTDLRMPEVNGVELLKRLREAGVTIPAIVVTGHADVQMAVEAIRRGAFDFIEKPFSDSTIIRSINQAINSAATAVDQRQAAHARTVVESLTKRELDVMRGVVDGLSNKAIAEIVGISPQSVEDHRAALMEQMHAANLPELVRLTMNIEQLRGSNGH